MPLWSEGTLPTEETPTLTHYPAARHAASGAAMIVCPGGGYRGLADHEGEPVAEWLAGLGIESFVLRYRLGPRHTHPAMLDDASRALRTVRARADEWDIDPARIGILGFSAGGHLASTLATHFDMGNRHSPDPIERQSSRPDAVVLIYPVITLQAEFTHMGSRLNLLGPEPHADLLALLSNETQVTPQTPPAFLVHTTDDAGVPCENSLQYALALRQAGVPCELHLYAHGPHGFGMGTNDPVLSTWPGHCAAWLGGLGFLTAPTAPETA